ncbi:FGGY-family carbohydrate kinase [Mycoplana dimorpha]|uniref:Carbohydrate kinase of FGGY family protein n=1 Tax=Mycoplana dimorpha TaxID=28320 RepID=A0A2T5AXP1_MYCDI|nr:FGGY-family carbohydrate kinase [Mycoplana dimorpha]PTM91502.1 carbohydrate kinase of FGGY family protein [Mycoplana dimorpha]
MEARNLGAIFQLTGKTPDKVVFSAGASKSAHRSQIMANALGLPVVMPVAKEATALGTELHAHFVEAAGN